MHSIVEAILEFLFFFFCSGCGAYTEQRGDWCAECLARTLQVHRLPLALEMQQALDGAWAMGIYHGALRKLILGLKYQKKKSTLPYLHSFLQAASVRLPEIVLGAELATAVPLYAAREKQRGFNQAELIFREKDGVFGIPYAALLQRTRATQPQYGLGAKERAKNMKAAFALAGNRQLTGCHILLLDDILTTGSTLYACAKVLKKAGAASVTAIVLASDRT